MPTFTKKAKKENLVEALNSLLKDIDRSLKSSAESYGLDIRYTNYSSLSADIVDYCILKNKDIEGHISSSPKLFFRGKFLKSVTMQFSAIIGGVGFKLMYSALRKSIITFYYSHYILDEYNSKSTELAIKAYKDSIRDELTDIGSFFV